MGDPVVPALLPLGSLEKIALSKIHISLAVVIYLTNVNCECLTYLSITNFVSGNPVIV